MPVCLNPDFRAGNDLLSEHLGSSVHPVMEGAPTVHIGLINNMPDAALRATERQFIRLLDAASKNTEVLISFYTLPEVPRAEAGIRHVSRFYSDIRELWPIRLDGLIITGAEPRTSRLIDEPFWEPLTNIFKWAEYNTRSTILSCLSAHAAALYFDGLERRRLTGKCSGLFECRRESDHFLTAGAPGHFRIPHSRWNEIPESDLARNDYRVLSRSAEAGADIFVKQKRSLFVFFQGHPEYETNTLLLEYHRDLNRFLRKKAGLRPSVPEGYFDARTAEVLTGLHGESLIDALLANSEAGSGGNCPLASWSSVAEGIYANWLRYVGGSTPSDVRAPHQQLCESYEEYGAGAGRGS
jgi:homoserine O-succinyltransferase